MSSLYKYTDFPNHFQKLENCEQLCITHISHLDTKNLARFGYHYCPLNITWQNNKIKQSSLSLKNVHEYQQTTLACVAIWYERQKNLVSTLGAIVHKYIIIHDNKTNFRYPDASPIRTIELGNESVRISEAPQYSLWKGKYKLQKSWANSSSNLSYNENNNKGNACFDQIITSGSVFYTSKTGRCKSRFYVKSNHVEW